MSEKVGIAHFLNLFNLCEGVDAVTRKTGVPTNEWCYLLLKNPDKSI